MIFATQTIELAARKLRLNEQPLKKFADALTSDVANSLLKRDVSGMDDLAGFFQTHYALIHEFYAPQPEFVCFLFMSKLNESTQDLIKAMLQMSLPLIVKTLVDCP